ncbi:MAG: protein translocase SEC61 complex subunit gamma [Candidatus Aenigmatarchaeota archaeon]
MNLNIKRALQNCVRVLKVAKKPGFGEFSETAKICFTGLIVVGALGFVVYIVSVSSPIG